MDDRGMGMQARTGAAMKAMRIFCAVVLLSLGFGPGPAQALSVEALFVQTLASAQLDDRIGTAAADYRLPDGSFAGLCLAGEDGPLARHPHGLPHCEVCLLCASSLLPVADTASWLKTHFAWLRNSAGGSAAVSARAAVGRPRSRGPPMAIGRI
jgi:hypothetical protein